MVITFSIILKEVLPTLKSYEFPKKFIFYLAWLGLWSVSIIYIYICICILYVIKCDIALAVYLVWYIYLIVPISFVDFPFPIELLCTSDENQVSASSISEPSVGYIELLFFSLYQYYTVWLQYFYRSSWNQTMKILQIFIFKKNTFFPFIRWLGSGHIMYSMMIMLNNTVLHIWKMLRE